MGQGLAKGGSRLLDSPSIQGGRWWYAEGCGVVGVPGQVYAGECCVGVKKTGKGRRKVGRKKRRMRSKIRHRKG
jgi:hypothetical protein